MSAETFFSRHFEGRTVLVTGGAQGIGRGIVEAFARHGANVALADLHADVARDWLASWPTQTAQANQALRAYDVDLASRAAAVDLVERVESDFGRLDVLVHNAAYFPLMRFDAITPAVLERTLAVNLSACFWLAQAAMPAFVRQGGGRVLVTSSVTGPRVAYPGLAHYAASKDAVRLYNLAFEATEGRTPCKRAPGRQQQPRPATGMPTGKACCSITPAKRRNRCG